MRVRDDLLGDLDIPAFELLRTRWRRWRTDRMLEPRRWARRIGVDPAELDDLAADGADEYDVSGYLLAREWFPGDDVMRMYADGVDLNDLALAVGRGLDPVDALELAAIPELDFQGYLDLRRRDSAHGEVVRLHGLGVCLRTYAGALEAGFGRADGLLLILHDVPYPDFAYCADAGLTCREILDLHIAGEDLRAVAWIKRRTDGVPRSFADALVEGHLRRRQRPQA